MKYNLEFLRLIAVILVTFTHTRNNFTGGWEMLVFEDIPMGMLAGKNEGIIIPYFDVRLMI